MLSAVLSAVVVSTATHTLRSTTKPGRPSRQPGQSARGVSKPSRGPAYSTKRVQLSAGVSVRSIFHRHADGGRHGSMDCKDNATGQLANQAAIILHNASSDPSQDSQSHTPNHGAVITHMYLHTSITIASFANFVNAQHCPIASYVVHTKPRPRAQYKSFSQFFPPWNLDFPTSALG